MYNGIDYVGVGCQGDDNVCKDGPNQDGHQYTIETAGAYNFFFSCSNMSICSSNLVNVGFLFFRSLDPKPSLLMVCGRRHPSLKEPLILNICRQ